MTSFVLCLASAGVFVFFGTLFYTQLEKWKAMHSFKKSAIAFQKEVKRRIKNQDDLKELFVQMNKQVQDELKNRKGKK